MKAIQRRASPLFFCLLLYLFHESNAEMVAITNLAMDITLISFSLTIRQGGLLAAEMWHVLIDLPPWSVGNTMQAVAVTDRNELLREEQLAILSCSWQCHSF